MKNIIEIGSNDGSHTIGFLDNANVWCFEPNPIYANLLKNKFKRYKNVNIIEKAVSDFNGTSFFNLASDGLSSSLNQLTQFANQNSKIKYVDKILVDVIRMDAFLNQNKINYVDYFHCDAQGEDFKILKSFGEKISIIKRGKVEVSLFEDLYLNSFNYIDDVINFLKENDFDIINSSEIQLFKKSLKRYDIDVQFCKKNIKRFI